MFRLLIINRVTMKRGTCGGGGGYPIPQYREGSSLPNTVVQKDEKPHTAGLNDTAIPHIKIQITEKMLEKKLNIAIP